MANFSIAALIPKIPPRYQVVVYTLVGIVLVFGVYGFIYIKNNEEKYISRRFRSLEKIGTNIQEKDQIGTNIQEKDRD